jgi:hypothetical protein
MEKAMKHYRIREFSPLYWAAVVGAAAAMYLMATVILLMA